MWRFQTNGENAMNAKHWTAVTMTTLFLLNASLVSAQGRGRGHGKDKHGDEDSEEHYAFSSRDQDSMRDWYHEHENGLPPGLAKRDQLPPGLEKQLRERGTLPPG